MTDYPLQTILAMEPIGCRAPQKEPLLDTRLLHAEKTIWLSDGVWFPWDHHEARNILVEPLHHCLVGTGLIRGHRTLSVRCLCEWVSTGSLRRVAKMRNQLVPFQTLLFICTVPTGAYENPDCSVRLFSEAPQKYGKMGGILYFQRTNMKKLQRIQHDRRREKQKCNLMRENRFLFIFCILSIDSFLLFPFSRRIDTGKHGVKRNEGNHHFDLYVYVIDCNQSVERFERGISFYNTSPFLLKKVQTIESFEVELMIANETLTLNGINGIVKSEMSERSAEEVIKKYSLDDVACTISHLKAIQQAYEDGLESALIVESDTVLKRDFFHKWKMYADKAPMDWKILQWTTSNPTVNAKKSYQSNDFWISWSGHHWSTLAYTIRREGMRQILKHTSNFFSTNNTHKRRWEFHEPNMLLSDEIIYFIVGNTYTSTFCWVMNARSNDTFEGSDFHFGESKNRITNVQLREVKRSEKIAVIQNMRIRSMGEMELEIISLETDMRSLARSNPRSKWFVNVILTKPDLWHSFQSLSFQLSRRHIQLNVQISDLPFNKFLFVREKLDDISCFDYVLLKDNDMRLGGFEWNTFMHEKKKSIISAPYRVDREGLTNRVKMKIINAKNDTDFSVGLQDGIFFNAPHSKAVQIDMSLPVTALEMFMVLMRSDFAVWFFKQILSSLFLSQHLSWGPDLMWCIAAYDYKTMIGPAEVSSPCSLVTLSALHVDTRQMNKQKDFVTKGKKVLKKFRDSNVTKRWLRINNHFRFHYHALLNWCKANSHELSIDFLCAREFHLQQIHKLLST